MKIYLPNPPLWKAHPSIPATVERRTATHVLRVVNPDPGTESFEVYYLASNGTLLWSAEMNGVPAPVWRAFVEAAEAEQGKGKKE